MIITEIIPYGKMKSRVLTDGDLAFSVYRTELLKYGLAEGAELPEALWENVLSPLLLKRAKERLLLLLKSRDYTEAELMRKLKAAYCPEELASAAVSWARELHYADDRRFAENYIAWHSDGKSVRRLLADLREKGVPAELAKELIEAAEPDEDLNLDRELRKKRFDPENRDPKYRQRIFAYLARKGYGFSEISEAVRRAELHAEQHEERED